MAQYPSIHLLICLNTPQFMIVSQANAQMTIAGMSEEERRAVIKELAMAEDKVRAAMSLFDVEIMI